MGTILPSERVPLDPSIARVFAQVGLRQTDPWAVLHTPDPIGESGDPVKLLLWAHIAPTGQMFGRGTHVPAIREHACRRRI